MKKIFSIIRIILITGFLAILIMMLINAIGINEGKTQIESILEKDVTYFNDKLSFSQSYYKYKDENNIEYWVNKATGKFYYLYNPYAENIKTAISENKAKDLAYEEAKKWDKEFFFNDTLCETTDDTYYEFFIYQLDELGYKTGKFIIVKIASNQVQYLSMHTHKNRLEPELGCCISENKVIDIAYSAAKIEDPSFEEDNKYLVKASLYKDSEIWIWDITIWNITEDNILNKTSAIDTDTYFNCHINANTGDALLSRWIEK